ncbi:MAG: glutamate-semialdehyde -aminomutase-like protein [Pedosphaera sp.]|nr:glutamate-semialdehyde -aminomutase-like protein [Pedosphaera sp.]
MIVYGDPQFEARIWELLRRLEHKLAAADPNDLDMLRALLIQSGQFEQAMVDFLPQENISSIIRVQTVTDFAAAAFYATLQKCVIGLSIPLISAERALEFMSHELRHLRIFENALVTVKIPEGFEFYTLFPEQYCASALQWLERNSLSTRNRTALVVGIRSIGTSLSALVTATLAAAGWQTRRVTVRPTGHPFERKVDFAAHDLDSRSRALIVDEGPGISGSSMAAVAKALAASGFKPEQISFLPGHGGGPGSAASAETHAWWASTVRHVNPLGNLRWNGCSLTELLAQKSAVLCNEAKIPSSQMQDLSAGQWRQKVYSNETDWPAVCMPFEKSKYLYSTRSGVAVLWKFIGFGSIGDNLQSFREPIANEFFNREKTDHLTSLGYLHGFLALPWINGKPLVQSDANNSEVINAIAHRIIAAVGPPLSAADQADSVSRLSQMLHWNAQEVFGKNIALRTQAVIKAACNLPSGPSHGDGRMAPHNWIRASDGTLFKTGSLGNRIDHTIVGRQPVIWDVAGAMVEWDFTIASAAPLVRAVNDAFTSAINADALTFYCMAYAAFQMGQASLCADLCNVNPGEKTRLKSAVAFYRNQLVMELKRG